MVTVGVRLPCFGLAAALRCVLDPDSAAFLIERTAPRRVLEATDAAAAAGIRPGMTLREAVRLLPRAAVAPDDPLRAARAWSRVLDVLRSLPCRLDDAGPGLAFLVLPSGHAPERWFGRLRTRLAPLGLPVRCGAGASRFVAYVATHRSADTVCRSGREAAFVADAPLALLGLDDAVALRLRLLGVRTLGQLAALPPQHLARFGPDAVRWRALARGYDEPATAAGVW
jgi:nucleotidyltransferase/DNA polymerase involved in DNA repair